MQAPQPLQDSAVTTTLPPGWLRSARSGQRATQITQTTPCAARHDVASIATGGNARFVVAGAEISGHTSVQARQNVQWLSEKSR